MKITKKKALKLLDRRIAEFERLKIGVDIELMSREDYKQTYKSTELLLEELFSTKESDQFRLECSFGYSLLSFSLSEAKAKEEQLQRNLKHLSACVSHLSAYRQRVDDFWPEDELSEQGVDTSDVPQTQKVKQLPFVSKSFEEADKNINDHFEGILRALKIKYTTGEEYSGENIPTKVERLIEECDLAVVIATGRDRTEKGEEIASDWITREIGQITGKGKKYILLLERGVKPPAGVKDETEMIYFKRSDVESMTASTHQFLVALRIRGLVE